jgi:ribosome maturation factor RimP
MRNLERTGGEMGAEEQITEALTPAVQTAGLEIWDVERSGATLRVLVERPGGVDLDSIAQVTSAVSAILDQREDLAPAGRYMLEVSSPGLERRLRYPEHFARYLGEDVVIKTTEAVNGARRVRGTLKEATAEEVTVLTDVASGEAAEVHIPLGSIERANTVFTWGPPPKGAKTVPSRKRAAKVETSVGAPDNGPMAEASGEAG